MYTPGYPPSHPLSTPSQRLGSRTTDPMHSFINSLGPAQLQVRALTTSLVPSQPPKKRPRPDLGGSTNGFAALQGSCVSEPLQASDPWHAYSATHPVTYSQINAAQGPNTTHSTHPVIMGWPGDSVGPSITPASAFETLLWPQTSPWSNSLTEKSTTVSSSPPSPPSRPTSSHSLPPYIMPTRIPTDFPTSSSRPSVHGLREQQQRPACSRTHFSHLKSHSSLRALSSHSEPEKLPKRAGCIAEGPDKDPSKQTIAQNEGIRPVNSPADPSLISEALKLNLMFPNSQLSGDGVAAHARADVPHSSSIQAGADALFALMEEHLYAGAKALFQVKIKENEEELEAKRRWVMDETRNIAEERKKLKEEKTLVEAMFGAGCMVQNGIDKGHETIEEETKVLDERRKALEEEKRVLDDAHAKLEEYFKLTHEDRQKVAEERRLLEEGMKTLTEGQRLLERDRDTFNQERQQVEQQRQEIERERTVVDNERKALQAIRFAVQEEQRLQDESKKGLQDERDKLLSDWASLDSQKVAFVEEKAEIAQRMEVAEEERKIVEAARHQTAEEKHRLDEERKRIEEQWQLLQDERKQVDEVRSALQEERAALGRSKAIADDTRRLLEEKRKAVDEERIKLEKKLEQDRVVQSPKNPPAPPAGVVSVGPTGDRPCYPRGRYYPRGGGTFESRNARR